MPWTVDCRLCGRRYDKETEVNCPTCASMAAMHPEVYHWVLSVVEQATYEAVSGAMYTHNRMKNHTANEHYRGI